MSKIRPQKQYSSAKSWIDQAIVRGDMLNLTSHFNRPRISAETILKMVTFKNKSLGIHRTLHEESVIAEEAKE